MYILFVSRLIYVLFQRLYVICIGVLYAMLMSYCLYVSVGRVMVKSISVDDAATLELNNCFIYKNVEIADGCVVASNSVVKKSLLEPNMLYAGVHAKAICKIEN